MNESEATPDQLMALGIGGALCCLVFGAAFLAVLVWMFRSKSPPVQTGSGQLGGIQQPPPPAPSQPVADFHLSVIALGFDGYFRAQVQNLINAPATTLDPVGMRLELVQRVVRALLGVEPQWRHFGYGEKDLFDLPSAQQSFNNAVADFRARTARPEDGGALCVVTLVLCTRGRRLGVDRLDTRAQVHALLQDRLQVDAQTLLGTELLWAPPSGGLTEFAVKERFPEMHPLL